MAASEYVPGKCNIGRAEIARRLQFGWIGVAVTVALAAIFYLTRIPAAWRLALFFPAAGGAIGLLQGYSHFCADFGLRGVFNFGHAVGKTETVEQAEFRRKDRQKAVSIVLWSMAVGIIVAVGFALVA